jgi:hypothetical protein
VKRGLLHGEADCVNWIRREDTSFSEEKEAKRLYIFAVPTIEAQCLRNGHEPGGSTRNKSLLLLFFRKEDAS